MIGGNITAQIQVKSATSKNAVGEVVPSWSTVQTITGFLDYQSGSSPYTNYDAKIQESTHVFVADYVALNNSIKAENSRFLINNKYYDVTLIDNPMELNEHWEIFLKYTGD